MLGSLISGGLGIVGGLIGNSAAQNAASQQNKWNIENYGRRHQLETEDLDKAGLNRILSATGGGSVASAGMADTSGGMNLGVNAAKALSDVRLQEATTEATKTQAGLNNAQKVKTEKETGVIGPKASAEIRKLNSNTTVNEALVGKINSEKTLNSAKTGLTKAEKLRVEQEEKRIKGDPRTMIGHIFESGENASKSAKTNKEDWKDTGVLGIRYRKVAR